MYSSADRMIKYVVVSLLVLSSTALEARSQWNNQWGTQKKSAPAVPVTQLRTPIHLADIPDYNGKGAEFKGGYVDSTSSTTGNNYYMSWYAREMPQEILDWYKQALQGYGWKVTFANQCNVYAEKQGLTCNVRVLYITNPKFKSQLSIISSQKK